MSTKKSLIINDTGMVEWLWNNAHIVTEIEKILRQKKGKDATIAKIKRILDASSKGDE